MGAEAAQLSKWAWYMQMGSNLVGWAVGGGAVASTALYQIWAGTKQKELGAGSMQVLASLAIYAQLLRGLFPSVSSSPDTQ